MCQSCFFDEVKPVKGRVFSDGEELPKTASAFKPPEVRLLVPSAEEIAERVCFEAPEVKLQVHILPSVEEPGNAVVALFVPHVEFYSVPPRIEKRR